MLASPRGSFAPMQALVAGFCRMGFAAIPGPDTATLKRVQVAAGALLAASGSFEFVTGGAVYGGLLITGAIVTILSARAESAADPADAVSRSGTTPATDAKSEIILQLAAQKAAVRSASPAGAALNPDAWGELMARVSHDLRTPLNAVIGFSDVMGSELFGPVGDVRYREYIAHIRESGRELLKSAEDTLAITALLGGGSSGGCHTRVNLGQLADDLTRTSDAMGLDARVEDGADVLCERRGLRQALVNLIAEACLRAAPGARPQLSATCEDDFVIVEISVTAADRQAFAGEAPLHICIARVLLELQGAQLIEIESDGRWAAVTVLSRAAQHEFFAPGTVPMGWQPKPSHSALLPA